MAKKALSYTRDEQIVSVIAREFRPEDELAVTAMLAFAFIGAALAQRLWAPRLVLSTPAKGRYALISNVHLPFDEPAEDSIETLMGNESIFDFLVGGKWNIFMQPAQIDKFGNMNISVIGDWEKPTAALVGARGVPDNTTNGGRVYYTVNNHSTKTFVEKVDFVCGVGYTPERKRGIVKYGAVEKVFSELGVFDFDKKTGRMRLKSVHTGVTPQQVVENTGFELIMPKHVPETPPPTEEELHVLREIMDPLGVSRLDLRKGDDQKQVLKELMGGATYEMIYGK